MLIFILMITLPTAFILGYPIFQTVIISIVISSFFTFLVTIIEANEEYKTKS
jgi:hypothetical protein